MGFEHSLNEDDYGIIVSPEGKLKGVWVPVSSEHHPVPQVVANLCVVNFGIDPNSDTEISQTVH